MKKTLFLAACIIFVVSCAAGGGEESLMLGETVVLTGRVDVSALSSSGRAGSIYPYMLDIPADGVSKENVLGDDGSFYIRLKKGTPHMIAVFDAGSVFRAVLTFDGGTQFPLDTSVENSSALGLVSINAASMRATVENDPVSGGTFSGVTNVNLDTDSDGDGRPDITVEVTGAGTTLADGKTKGKGVDITGDWRFHNLPTGGMSELCAYVHQDGNEFEVYWNTGESSRNQYVSGNTVTMSWELVQCGQQGRYSLNGSTDGRLMSGQYAYSGGCGDSSGSWFAERAYCEKAHP